MIILIALGGNALLRRSQRLTEENQLTNIKRATEQIAQLPDEYQLVITHGNGPQIGLLALQNAADTSVTPYPLDLLGAETDGMIGYLSNLGWCNIFVNRLYWRNEVHSCH